MKLIITAPNQAARELQLASSASIGRSADNTIHVDDTGVARYHAMIELRPTGFWLNDLGSTNGTLVNGAKLAAAHQLQTGDTIGLGQGTAIRVAGLEQAGAATQASPASVSSVSSASSAGAKGAKGADAGVSGAHLAVAVATVFVLLAIVGIGLAIIKNRGTGGPGEKSPPATPLPTVVVSSPEGRNTPPELPPAASARKGNTAMIEGLVGKLASQLSGRGNYIFAPEMIAAIAARTAEYSVDVTAPARAYRLEVDRAFGNAKGLKPLYGHILAHSRSRYGTSGGTGIGVWQIPVAIAQEYGETPATANTPKRSAELAAAHFDELIDVFAPEDFMYALACFGLPSSEAGKLNARLRALDPNDRRDFWKQVKAGIVSREGAEKVISFFAAGIVGEYPANFELKNAIAFSDL